MAIELNVGGAPAGLEQDFATPATPWTAVYWTPGELAFNDSAGSVDGDAPGATIAVTLSIISGAATGGATAGAQTVTGNVTIISGAATGGAAIAGQTITLTASVIAGAASAGAGAGGQTIATTVSVISGAATGGATAGGQTVSGNVTIVSGAATGEGAGSGAILTVTASIIAGLATGESAEAPVLRGRGYSIDLGWHPHKAKARNVIGWMIFTGKEEREPPVDIKVNFAPALASPRNILKPPVIDKSAVIARRKAQVLAIFEQSLQADVAVVQRLLERV